MNAAHHASAAVITLLLACLGLTLAQGRKPEQRPKPTAEATVIILKDRHWVLEELTNAVYDEVTRGGKMPADPKLHVSVRIMPQDTNTMCNVVFSQGFGRPYWRVAVGYDGKVKSISQGVKREGG